MVYKLKTTKLPVYVLVSIYDENKIELENTFLHFLKKICVVFV